MFVTACQCYVIENEWWKRGSSKKDMLVSLADDFECIDIIND